MVETPDHSKMIELPLRLRRLLCVLTLAVVAGALVYARQGVSSFYAALGSLAPASDGSLSSAVETAPPKGTTAEPVTIYKDEALELAAERLRPVALAVEEVGAEFSWTKFVIFAAGTEPPAPDPTDAGVPLWVFDYRGVFQNGSRCFNRARVQVDAMDGSSTLEGPDGREVPCPPPGSRFSS